MWRSEVAGAGFFFVFSVRSVLNAFKDLTQRTLRKDTEGTEKARREFEI